MNSNYLLRVEKLNTRIFYKDFVVNAVCDLDLELREHEIIAIVGESGCGKTMSMLSLTNLLPRNARITSGHIYFSGKNMEINNEKELMNIRGSQISYIFQDAAASLNPLFCAGEQIQEVFITHNKISKEESRNKTLEVMDLVQLTPTLRYFWYFPHQLSGGMNQRVMIAMAIASKPKLLIADEPTSSVDRITEIKILDLLSDLNRNMGISIIIITHNIFLIKDFAQRIAVMYAGRVVETGSCAQVLNSPKHPYTEALLGCLPRDVGKNKSLNTIKGSVCDLSKLPQGCKFHPRCPYVFDKCLIDEPQFREASKNQFVKCYLW